MRFPIALIIIFVLFHGMISGQVSLNTAGNPPDASAVLDVSSTVKGILIPRMSTGDRDLIGTPATGLMIYNTTTNAFNYWNGAAWIAMTAGNIKELTDADLDTKVEVERNPDEDIIHFKVAGTEVAYFNTKSLQFFGSGNSLYIGEDAGNSDDGTALNNTIVGSFAGGSIISADQNVSIGSTSSENLVSGADNTMIGYAAGNSNNATGNTFIGSQSGAAV